MTLSFVNNAYLESLPETIRSFIKKREESQGVVLRGKNRYLASVETALKLRKSMECLATFLDSSLRLDDSLANLKRMTIGLALLKQLVWFDDDVAENPNSARIVFGTTSQSLSRKFRNDNQLGKSFMEIIRAYETSVEFHLTEIHDAMVELASDIGAKDNGASFALTTPLVPGFRVFYYDYVGGVESVMKQEDGIPLCALAWKNHITKKSPDANDKDSDNCSDDSSDDDITLSDLLKEKEKATEKPAIRPGNNAAVIFKANKSVPPAAKKVVGKPTTAKKTAAKPARVTNAFFDLVLKNGETKRVMNPYYKKK